jgi:hypothetical protein
MKKQLTLMRRPSLSFRKQIQLQNHAPFKRFAKAPVPPPLQAQAEGLAAEQEDGVTTLQSEQ